MTPEHMIDISYVLGCRVQQQKQVKKKIFPIATAKIEIFRKQIIQKIHYTDITTMKKFRNSFKEGKSKIL